VEAVQDATRTLAQGVDVAATIAATKNRDERKVIAGAQLFAEALTNGAFSSRILPVALARDVLDALGTFLLASATGGPNNGTPSRRGLTALRLYAQMYNTVGNELETLGLAERTVDRAIERALEHGRQQLDDESAAGAATKQSLDAVVAAQAAQIGDLSAVNTQLKDDLDKLHSELAKIKSGTSILDSLSAFGSFLGVAPGRASSTLANDSVKARLAEESALFKKRGTGAISVILFVDRTMAVATRHSVPLTTAMPLICAELPGGIGQRSC
jgi:hypothetical protein